MEQNKKAVESTPAKSANKKVTDAPATDANVAPATDANVAPATDAPATDAPVTDAPATDANVQPATEKLDTELSAEEVEAAKVAALAEKEAKRKDAIKAKIAETRLALAKAIERKNRYVSEDEDVLMSVEFLKEKSPATWNAIQTDPDTFAAEIKALELSLLSPEEAEVKKAIEALEAEIATKTSTLAKMREEAIAKYPELFGAVEMPKLKKADKAPKDLNSSTTVANRPFTGTINSEEHDTAKVKEFVAQGITSESEMIRRIYGNDFDIVGSKPRFRIHSIREKLGLLAKK